MDNLEKCMKNMIQELVNNSENVDFHSHPILRNLMQKTFDKHARRNLGLVWIFLIPVLAISAMLCMDSNPCFWRSPDWIRDLLRTPVNCSVCKYVDRVQRLDKIHDPHRFIRDYVDIGIPVVVSDATDVWSARNAFSFEFFRNLYSNKSRANCQFFRYKSKFESLQDVFETASFRGSEEPWYVGWSNCDGEIAEILRSHYDRPYFLPETSESAHTDWIFMGSPAYGAHLHVDDVEYPSWQAQIRGRKKWLLYPPPECHYSCPRKFLEIILEPGDTLVVDTNWWYHQTLVVGDDLSISIGSEFD